MSIDFESLKDKAVVAAQNGVTRAKELTETGMSKAKELTEAGLAKAKEMKEIGKLKVNNSAEQESIRKAYSELGKLYFAERGSAPEPAYAEICQRIADAMSRISYNNERIADIKAAGHLTDDEVDSLGEDEAFEEASCGCEAKEEECGCGGEDSSCCGSEEDGEKPE